MPLEFISSICFLTSCIFEFVSSSSALLFSNAFLERSAFSSVDGNIFCQAEYTAGAIATIAHNNAKIVPTGPRRVVTALPAAPIAGIKPEDSADVNSPATIDAKAATLPETEVMALTNPPIALLVFAIFAIVFAANATARATPTSLISGLKTGILFSKIFRISTILDRPS